jgi:hypothetical protein
MNWRRFVAGASVVCLVLSMTGVPLPATPIRKDKSIPFPCQDRPCGCQSAEECRLHCCCFNEAEKRSWAAGRGVDPQTVLPPNSSKEWTRPRSTPPAGSCCSTRPAKETSSCCQSAEKEDDSKAPPASCCSQDSNDEDCCNSAAPAKTSVRKVLGLFHAKCKGAESGWMCVKWTAPVAPMIQPPLEAPSLDCVACESQFRIDVCRTPEVPPPRSLSL